MQSPIGLVPKAGNKTRLIFHLSYDFNGKKGTSINVGTPKEKCSVKYNDVDQTIRICFNELKRVNASVKGQRTKRDNSVNVSKDGTGKTTFFFLKTDLSAAFWMVPCSKKFMEIFSHGGKGPING